MTSRGKLPPLERRRGSMPVDMERQPRSLLASIDYDSDCLSASGYRGLPSTMEKAESVENVFRCHQPVLPPIGGKYKEFRNSYLLSPEGGRMRHGKSASDIASQDDIQHWETTGAARPRSLEGEHSTRHGGSRPLVKNTFPTPLQLPLSLNVVRSESSSGSERSSGEYSPYPGGGSPRKKMPNKSQKSKKAEVSPLVQSSFTFDKLADSQAPDTKHGSYEELLNIEDNQAALNMPQVIVKSKRNEIRKADEETSSGTIENSGNQFNEEEAKCQHDIKRDERKQRSHVQNPFLFIIILDLIYGALLNSVKCTKILRFFFLKGTCPSGI